MWCGFYINKKKNHTNREWSNPTKTIPPLEQAPKKRKSCAQKKERWGNLPCHEAKGKWQHRPLE